MLRREACGRRGQTIVRVVAARREEIIDVCVDAVAAEQRGDIARVRRRAAARRVAENRAVGDRGQPDVGAGDRDPIDPAERAHADQPNDLVDRPDRVARRIRVGRRREGDLVRASRGQPDVRLAPGIEHDRIRVRRTAGAVRISRLLGRGAGLVRGLSGISCAAGRFN
jgi:hypothetical protein